LQRDFYFVNDAIAKARYAKADKMNFEAPLTVAGLDYSIVSVVITFIVSSLTIPTLGAMQPQCETRHHHLRHVPHHSGCIAPA